MDKLVLGTRGSKLAMKQARLVADGLGSRINVELRIIKTRGDFFLEKPLDEFPGTGTFVDNLNGMVLKGEIDAAVHSMKDLPTEIPDSLTIAAVLPRASPLDVLISNHRLKDLPMRAIVGTSSKRRRAQLLRLRPDLRIKDIRGNIDTRIRKLDSASPNRQTYDAIVTAKAGMMRLGFDGIGGLQIEELPFITSAGQGAIAVVTKEDSEAETIVEEFDDRRSRMETETERMIMGTFGGGCGVPMGVMADVKDGFIFIRAEILSTDGSRWEYLEREIPIRGYKQNAMDVGRELKRLWKSSKAG
jgi:hydroxymethylbilane synthase